MSSELERELRDIRRSLLTMSAIAEQRVAQAFEAMLTRNMNVAQVVRENDDEIDELEVDLEAECMRVLALHHPVASDLRFVLMALRVNIDLERVADLAKGVSKRVLDLGKHPRLPMPPGMAEMAADCQAMLSDGLRALANSDADLAERVRAADEAIDERHRAINVWVVRELPGHIDNAQVMIDLLFIARAIERIGDMVTNIAEDVIFCVRGDIVRHAPIVSSSS